jgi:hypothetical protein
MNRKAAMRKPPQRATMPHRPGRVMADEVRAWLDARLAEDPQLGRSIKRVLAALRRAEAAAPGRRRRVR